MSPVKTGEGAPSASDAAADEGTTGHGPSASLCTCGLCHNWLCYRCVGHTVQTWHTCTCLSEWTSRRVRASVHARERDWRMIMKCECFRCTGQYFNKFILSTVNLPTEVMQTAARTLTPQGHSTSHTSGIHTNTQFSQSEGELFSHSLLCESALS